MLVKIGAVTVVVIFSVVLFLIAVAIGGVSAFAFAWSMVVSGCACLYGIVMALIGYVLRPRSERSYDILTKARG